MGSQAGMCPKLSLPSINCQDSKAKGQPLNMCSPLPSQDPLLISLLPAPTEPFPLYLQGPPGHSDLIRLSQAGEPPHSDRWGGRRFEECGAGEAAPWLVRARAISQQSGTWTSVQASLAVAGNHPVGPDWHPESWQLNLCLPQGPCLPLAPCPHPSPSWPTHGGAWFFLIPLNYNSVCSL